VIEVANSNNAVLRLLGAMSPQMMMTGIISGRNALRKSLMTSCLSEIDRAIYMMRPIAAMSDVWMLSPIPGMAIHRRASLISGPKNMVKSSKGMEPTKMMGANREYTVYGVL